MTSCGVSEHLSDHSWTKLYVNIQVDGACVHYVMVSKFQWKPCHPALSTDWLDWVVKWCELWCIRTGYIYTTRKKITKTIHLKSTYTDTLHAWKFTVCVPHFRQKTNFKSWAVMGFSVAHQCPPAIDFVCVAMAGSHTWKGSIDTWKSFLHDCLVFQSSGELFLWKCVHFPVYTCHHIFAGELSWSFVSAVPIKRSLLSTFWLMLRSMPCVCKTAHTSRSLLYLLIPKSEKYQPLPAFMLVLLILFLRFEFSLFKQACLCTGSAILAPT